MEKDMEEAKWDVRSTEDTEPEQGGRSEILQFLKDEVKRGMKLPELVDIYERMLQIPVAGDWEPWEDMALFEAGTFSFTGEPMFMVSLVRQYPNDEDEFFQLHLEALFRPEQKTDGIRFLKWSDGVEGDFCMFIRNSVIYRMMEQEMPAEINIYLDET